jgi:hypothetical protein
MRKPTTLAGAVVLLSLTSGSAFSQAIYRLTELEGPGFRFSTDVTDINDAGRVTGPALKGKKIVVPSFGLASRCVTSAPSAVQAALV